MSLEAGIELDDNSKAHADDSIRPESLFPRFPRAVRAVSRRRLLRPLGAVTHETQGEVDRALSTVLGLQAG